MDDIGVDGDHSVDTVEERPRIWTAGFEVSADNTVGTSRDRPRRCSKQQQTAVQVVEGSPFQAIDHPRFQARVFNARTRQAANDPRPVFRIQFARPSIEVGRAKRVDGALNGLRALYFMTRTVSWAPQNHVDS